MSKKIRVIAAFVMLVLGAAPSQAAIGSLWAFGDSLLDSGNVAQIVPVDPPPWTDLVPSAAYPGGTFSNGPVWAEYLAGSLGLPLQPLLSGGTNFAFGGAGTGNLPSIGLNQGFPPNVLTQAAIAAGIPGALPSDGLYIVGGGGNDVRRATQHVIDGGNPLDAISAVGEAVVNLTIAVSLLVNDGAQQFVVPNLPAIGLTPEMLGNGPGAATFATQLSVLFNTLLDTSLDNIELLNPGVDIIRLDTFTLFNVMLGNPALFGFTNTNLPCALQNGGLGCANPNEYVFWDGIHPTTRAHEIAAAAAYAQIVPIPPSVLLFGTGIAALSLRYRRARAG